MKIYEADIAGRKLEHEGKIYYQPQRHGFNDGVIYKDYKAFESGEGTCYIPEYAIPGNGAFDEFVEPDLVLPDEGDWYLEENCGIYTKKDFVSIAGKHADMLFEDVDWQHPETLWEEYDTEDIDEEDVRIEEEKLKKGVK